MNHGFMELEKAHKLLSEQAERKAKYRADVKFWTEHPDYSAEYKEKKLAGLKKEFERDTINTQDEFIKSIRNARSAESERSKKLDISDPKLKSTIELIRAIGPEIGVDTTRQIVQEFRGNNAALTVIRSVLESMGLREKNPDGSEYSTSIGPVDLIAEMTYVPDRVYSQLEGMTNRAFDYEKGSLSYLSSELESAANLAGYDMEAEPVPRDGGAREHNFTKYNMI